MFLANLLIILTGSMFLLSGCASAPPVVQTPAESAPAEIKSLRTAEEYLREAKQHFDAEQYSEAQQYAAEASRLDPKNQAARLLSGVAFVKLGKGNEAHQEFTTVIRIDSNTADATTAKQWLERFKNPLTIAIYPNSDATIEIEKKKDKDKNEVSQFPEAGEWFYLVLADRLAQCGFYSINRSNQQIKNQNISNVLKSCNNKIAIICKEIHVKAKDKSNESLTLLSGLADVATLNIFKISRYTQI